MRELASQSANGVLSNGQRGTLDQEAQALRDEFNRIIEVTELNNLSLLKGEVSTLSIQAGYSSVDLAFADLGTSVTGDGTFQAGVSYQEGTAQLSALSYDVNGDGILDVVSISDTAPGLINVMLGNGDGTFNARITYAGATSPRLISADLNGDGVPDLVAGSTTDARVSVLFGNSDGSFKARVTYLGGGFVGSVTTADVNGDGVLDIVTTSGSDEVLQ